jgi:aerobic C4-dicarboxylate transport protein
MATQTQLAPPPAPRKKFYQNLYVQVLLAIGLGVLLGHFYPALGEQMKPLGDIFIKMIRMMIAPIIFCTVVHGIASTGDLKKVGRIGLKALIYFEVMTTIALALGLLTMNLAQPGAGMNVDPSTIDPKSVAGFANQAQNQSVIDFLMHIVPTTVVGAFAQGEILQVLFFSVPFAFALNRLGERGRPFLQMLDIASHSLFGIVGYIMKVAPIGAFGAMAFTIGKYGVASLISLGKLLLTFYATCLLFIFVFLWAVAHYSGFSLWSFIKYIKEELLVVLGTSSSESVLPRMITKMEVLGCDESVVGLVIPTGYSFNLDGSCIMLTTIAIFIAQATNTPLDLWHQMGLLAVLLLTSKGAAGVTGTVFVVLAATLSAVGTVPVAGLALVLGVYRFLSEGAALTNLIGNGVATIFMAKLEGALDEERMREVLNHETAIEADEPEKVLVT